MLQFDVARLRPLRILATIIAAAIVVQALRAIADPYPQAPAA